MPFSAINGGQLVVIVLLVVLLFAAPKLPSIARNLGQSMRIFSSEVKTMRDENKDRKDAQASAGEGSHAAGAATEPVEGRVVDPQSPRDDR